MSVTCIIPVVEYKRPDGRQVETTLQFEAGDETVAKRLADKLELLRQHDITITIEGVMGGLINVCLDDRNIDYEFELFPDDGEFSNRVAELVLTFDEKKYKATALLASATDFEWTPCNE